MLTKNQSQWDRVKEKFDEVRIKYRDLKEKIVARFNSTGMRILIRSRKPKWISSKKQKLIHDDQYQPDDKPSNATNAISSNKTSTDVTSRVDHHADDIEYEYDDLDSSDTNNEFEQIDNIMNACNQMVWNAFNDTSTVYILTTYIVSGKTICSLSDVEADVQYHHVCKYGL